MVGRLRPGAAHAGGRAADASSAEGHQPAVPEADVPRRVFVEGPGALADSTSRVLDIKNIPWAEFALWAPSAIQANGKYYLFFAANDIQSDQEDGGIGVAVADRPEGPFMDALGKPLIDKFHNGAQPIDPFVFRDDDGQHYLYYGGWRHCNVVRLTADLQGVVPFADGETFKEITPANYVEGPFVFKRGGKYYLMWSEGGWGGPNYSVAYAIGDSPLGPVRARRQDPAAGPGGRDRRRAPLGHPDSRLRHVVHRLPPASARDEERQPSRGVHRRDALQRGRHDSAGDDHVRRREGQAAGPIGGHHHGHLRKRRT